MATHSSVLAWRIPGRGSMVGCHLWGRAESDTAEATCQQQQQQFMIRNYKLFSAKKCLSLYITCNSHVQVELLFDAY